MQCKEVTGESHVICYRLHTYLGNEENNNTEQTPVLETVILKAERSITTFTFGPKNNERLSVSKTDEESN